MNKLEILTNDFIGGLRKRPNGVDMHIYYNLFELLEMSDPNFLEEIIENYKKDNEDFFRIFHKMFRQGDIFDSDRISSIIYPLRTPELQKRKNEVMGLRQKYRRNYDDDGKFESLKSEDEYENDVTYIELGKELGVLAQKLSKISIDFDNPITGHLDSIFYETISRDDKDTLYVYMRNFFDKNIKE